MSNPGGQTQGLPLNAEAPKEISKEEPVADNKSELLAGTSEEHGEYHRSFSTRQVHLISLSSNVGSGLFIGNGKALASGGPASMILAYLTAGIGCWANLHTLAEMTIAFPTSGNYIDYAGRWVDPAIAFGAGFAEWLGWVATFAAEGVFFIVLVNFWAEGAVPEGALLTIFLVISYVVFLMPNNVFAWLQYVGALVKVFLFVLLIILSCAVIGGAGPQGFVHHGEYWTDLPAFKNGFAGFANAALLAMWAVGDQIFVGVMGGEAQNPRYSMAHAANLVPFRVDFILLVPSNHPRLLGGGDSTASPFIIAVQQVGIAGIPHLFNVCMIVTIMAIGLEAIYLSSRILREMALQKLIPEFIANVDNQGRPRWSLFITSTLGTILTWLTHDVAGGERALDWFISITSTSFFMNWAIVALTSFRFRAALRAQNDPLFSEAYAWKVNFWPLGPMVVLCICVLMLACCILAGAFPLNSNHFTAYNFFQYMIGLIIICTFTVAYKLIYKTPWRDPATADLVTRRRPLTVEELEHLDRHFEKPLWRRIGTYAKVW
ncbi:Amino acid polyamine transporter I [Fusarium albosuccineum]|uniref:Amino acid polyamine transporter I n=1 Tax=Fusarium albosuccineum TaxID=1237068 RepID=A0A8H4L2A5_9HYPO|nr:Amino acid polyamine transporter I [Fusarium albosuccineum]